MHYVIKFNQPQWLRSYIEFNAQERIEPEKNNDKVEKRCTF